MVWVSGVTYLDGLRPISQIVALNGYISVPSSIPSGIPQGSLLGPLLFTIFINDIESCFKNAKIILYADDMKILFRISDISDCLVLQQDLDSLLKYCTKNKLELNVSKCFVISFTRKPNFVSYQYKLNNMELKRIQAMRDLGVTFDSKLLFDAHIDNIIKKATKTLGFILRLSADFRNIKTFKILYCTFIRSHLEYASQIWNPNYSIYIDRIERVQKRFLRFLQFKTRKYSSNYIVRCKRFHMLPLHERRRIADITTLFKIANGEMDCPELLSKLGLVTHTALLRNPRLLHVPRVNTTYRQNSFMLRASKSFNVISRDVVDLDLFNTSVARLKRCLVSNFFI